MQHTDWHRRRTRGERPAASTYEAVTTVVQSMASGAARWAAIQVTPSTPVHPGRALHFSAPQSPHLQNSDNDTIKLLNLVLGWNKYLNQEPGHYKRLILSCYGYSCCCGCSYGCFSDWNLKWGHDKRTPWCLEGMKWLLPKGVKQMVCLWSSCTGQDSWLS